MKRLAYIDSLRGLASLVVAIFWHYQHFSISFQPNSIDSSPPFYSLVIARFFFEYGDTMVDLFFVLSGVIFSYTYREAVKTGHVDAYSFFIKRFSRLYPVHLFTLVFLSVLVIIYFQLFGRFPIYKLNDLYHFVLNLLFLQKGFFDYGYSFNSPAWSLSIEAFLYIIFFIQSRYRYTIFSSIILVVIGFSIYRLPFDLVFLINHPVARGLLGFFCGSIVYELLIKTGLYEKYRWLTIILFMITVVAYVYYIRLRLVVAPHLLMVFVASMLVVELYYNQAIRYMLENRVFLLLGDISLSAYLIHVPIQILFLFYFNLDGSGIPYNSKLLLVTYGLFVIGVGWLLHITIEKPAQAWLRTKLKSVRKQPLPLA